MFKVGLQNLLNGKCSEARKQNELIAQLMAVPLVQGTVRYAYITDSSQNDVDEKPKAEGAVFAASVVPIMHACNTGDAQTIYENMGVGSPAADFSAMSSSNNKAVAIGVSIVVIAALLLFLGICYWRRRKSTEIDPKLSSADGSAPVGQRSGL